MTYTEVLALFETDEIDFMSALELSGCDTIIELYEGAADEQDAQIATLQVEGPQWPIEGRA